MRIVFFLFCLLIRFEEKQLRSMETQNKGRADY